MNGRTADAKLSILNEVHSESMISELNDNFLQKRACFAFSRFICNLL